MESHTYIALVPTLQQVSRREASRYLPSAEEVEDTVQDILLRLWERHTQLETDPTRLAAYTRTLTRHHCLDLLRSRRRHPLQRLVAWALPRGDRSTPYESPLPYDPPTYHTPQRQLEQSENEQLFHLALDSLPYRWRTVLLLRNQEDMTFQQIATLLGTSEANVRALLSKARHRMIQLINAHLQ